MNSYVEILIVGGGGAGGGRHGGGGGGGGVIYNPELLLDVGSYTAMVGVGGIPSTSLSSQTVGGSGGNSRFHNMVALGGGGGGSYAAPVPTGGGCGGGGGGGTNMIGGLAQQALINEYGHGFNGGYGGIAYGGGGGGGAGSVGINATTYVGGNGGYGFESSISGFSVKYAGGGGGGGSSGGGVGFDGGGNGAISGGAGNGIDGLGGGGGGTRSQIVSTTGGYGGRGVIIISYFTGDITATGGVITEVSGKTIHSFYSSGIFNVVLSPSHKRRNICYNNSYVFKPTAAGVNIYNADSESIVNQVALSDGANSVWANDDYFYIATSSSGIYRCPSNTISGILMPESYKIFPDITHNCVNYIHGNGDYLCAVTASGVDQYKLSDGTREYKILENISKCFQMSNGDYYFTVNSFYDAPNLDDNIYKWNYGRVVELSTPVPEDDYQFVFEIPKTQPDDIYFQSQINGADIRVIDDKGRSVSYYIESWTVTSPIRILVKLYKGTQKLYVIYGNKTVKAKSNIKDAYRVFDDFNDPTLSDLWIFDNGGYANNTYTISNSIIRLNTYSNSYPLYLYSSKIFNNDIIEYSFRMIPGSSYTDDMDWVAGFRDGISVYIGCINNGVDEFPHYLDSASSSGTIYGTKLASTSFKTHTFLETPNYQMSNYDGETLVSSGILNNSAYKQIKFTYNNAYYEPKIEIDWIRARSFDPSPPTYTISRGQSIDDLLSTTKLYAIYSDKNEYIYEAKQNNILNNYYISDLYITEGTSRYNNGNVIFLATSWGAVVIEEKRGDESNGVKRVYLLES